MFADGVRTYDAAPRFRITGAAYLGAIDPENPTEIEWRELPPHAGPPLYRMASIGIGCDGRRSEPSTAFFAYNVDTGTWETFVDKALASMDHRGFAALECRLFILGGMIGGQQVTNRVQMVELSSN